MKGAGRGTTRGSRRIAAVLAGVTASGAAAGDGAAPLTFTKDVAPIVFDHCAVCHRPGEAAPFSLLSYGDVKKRARQIVTVTQSRYMPPWLPAPGFVRFEGERLLTEAQVERIRRWVAEGTAEGDPADLPPVPTWTEGWQLGEPDLVLEMTAPYTLDADGADVFRDFVVPIPIEETRYVKAVEFRPGNPVAIHHVIIEIDPTRASRRLDAADEESGFEGMVSGDSIPPDGHFIGWTPGKLPSVTPEGMAWRLEKGSDMILQLHMLPTGKPEPVAPKIGIHFAETPPTRFPFMILMANFDIDIPAGAADHKIEDTYRLPVDVDALGIYPHAHYLGKDLKAYAILPDGSRQWLVRIPDWDFNWQDEYRYTEPVFLPRGTTLRMEYSFDNSADNVRNPSHPPRRVVFGNRSDDEMASYLLQVLPRNPSDRAILARDYELKFPYTQIRRLEDLVTADPGDAASRSSLAFLYLRVGDIRRAYVQFIESLRLEPNNSPAHNNLALIYRQLDEPRKALEHFAESLRINPDNVSAHNNLAWTLATHPDAGIRDGARALRHAQRAAALYGQPSVALMDTLAAAQACAGQYDEAVRTAERAIALATGPRRRGLVEDIRQRLAYYRQAQPYVE